jgi:hypothetical protein
MQVLIAVRMNLLATPITSLLPIKLAVDALRRKDLLTADVAIKFMMETLGNENSEIVRELQMVLKLRISHRRTRVVQVLQYLPSGTQDDTDLFPRFCNDTTAKIILRSIIRPSSSENDGQNSTLEDQQGTEHQCIAILSKIRSCPTQMRHSH